MSGERERDSHIEMMARRELWERLLLFSTQLVERVFAGV
jgi:hypothetical protein